MESNGGEAAGAGAGVEPERSEGEDDCSDILVPVGPAEGRQDLSANGWPIHISAR